MAIGPTKKRAGVPSAIRVRRRVQLAAAGAPAPMQWPSVRVVPGAGRRVRLAGGKIVPASGIVVQQDLFIRRLIRDGDLVVVTAAPMPTKSAMVPATAPKKEG